MSSRQEAEDEAFAQALQDEYRKDFLRRQAERNQRRSNNNNNSNNRSRNNSITGQSLDRGEKRNNSTKSTRSEKRNNSTRSEKRNNSTKSTLSEKRNNSTRSEKRNNSTRSEKRNNSTKSTRSEKRNNNNSTTTTTTKSSSSTSKNNSERPKRQHRDGSHRRRKSTSSKAVQRVHSAGDEWLALHSSEHSKAQQQEVPPHRSLSVPTMAVLPPPNVDWDEEYARRMQQEEINIDLPSRDVDLDEEYARRIQLEENKSHTTTTTTRPKNIVVKGRLPTTNKGTTIRSFSMASSCESTTALTEIPDDDSDEAIARRIQQELEDAEYAQRISLQEQQEMATRGVLEQEYAQQLQEQQPVPKRSCLARWSSMIFCLAVCITIPLLFLFDVFDLRFLDDFFGPDWITSDPFSGMNTTIDYIDGTAVPSLPPNAYGWGISSKTVGLELEILNGCSDDYLPFVEEAIANWENGSPIDSLTLPTKRVEYDPDCSSDTAMGKLVICNGDYGDTRWRGLNEVALHPRQPGIILSSSAQLNQFYLDHESDAQKLYTACHELGHGFGLPHWDENFFNRDLGNCMDYTQRPDKNSGPDASNFFYLAQLYGGIEVSTNQPITAEEAKLMAIEEEESSSSTESSSSSSSPQSRLLLSNGNTKGRRVLAATEDYEVHIEESQQHPGVIIVKHYLLVKDEP